MTEIDEPAEEAGPAELELGARLAQTRAIPAAGFRGALSRHLAADDPGYGPRPPHLRLIAAAYAAAGTATLAVGALVATGRL